jgi:hypothetical protein
MLSATTERRANLLIIIGFVSLLFGVERSVANDRYFVKKIFEASLRPLFWGYDSYCERSAAFIVISDARGGIATEAVVPPGQRTTMRASGMKGTI